MRPGDYLVRFALRLEPFSRKNPASARSSGVVTLILRLSPGTIRTGRPSVSNARASSVQARCPPRLPLNARSSAAREKTWGVCAHQRSARSTVPTTSPRRTRFTVSATGRAGIAPPLFPPRRAAATTRRTRATVRHGRAASWIATQRISAGSAASPSRTDSGRTSPPETIRTGTARLPLPVPAARRRTDARSPAGATSTIAPTPGNRAKRSNAWRKRGFPATGRSAFRTAPGSRRPWPAARSTTPIDPVTRRMRKIPGPLPGSRRSGRSASGPGGQAPPGRPAKGSGRRDPPGGRAPSPAPR